MSVNYNVYTKKIVEIKVPHSIYDLFEYEDQYNYVRTNIYYGMYQLSRMIEDMEDETWDITAEDKKFIYEVYKLCERMFKENALIEVHFLDKEY